MKKKQVDWGREKTAARRRTRAARPAPEPKMGRPRTGEDIRIARGVRLGPDLLERVDAIIADKRADNVDTFTAAVERALGYWLNDVEAGMGSAIRDHRRPRA